MLYLLHGSSEFTKNELKKIRQALLTKRPEALFFSFDEEDEGVDIEELARGKGLFEERFLIELDGLFEAGVFEDKEEVVLEMMSSSDNVFFVLEKNLPKRTFTLFQKLANKVSEEKAKKSSWKEFSAFSLADALGERNKPKLWLLFQEAVARNYAMEEIHGIFFWQIKMIALADKTSSAEEAGVKNFPYSKAKKFVNNFASGEIEKMLATLTMSLSRSRSRGVSLKNELERFILNS